MRIFLASYFEPENHGPGRKIGISPSKPKNLMAECGYECDFCYDGLSPEEVFWDYHKAKKAANGDLALLKIAGDEFVNGYLQKLASFKKLIEIESEKTGESIQNLIGLEEGDSLLSWERDGHISYRTHTAQFLQEMGYDVEEH